MSCGCGKKKCNGKCGISPSVLQINNNECTLFHKVEIPAVMGDETTNPPKTGAYRNVLLYYEASGNSYLYSSDGIPTKLTGVVSDYEVLTNKPSINGVVLIKNKTLADLGIISAINSAVADEATARENADNALSERITTNANNIAANATAISNEVTARTNADNTLSARISGNTTAINNEKTARENADTALSNRITANANAISAETTTRENADNALSGRITANADAISGEKTARENADAGLQDQITAVKATADSAVQPDDIDKTVMSDLAVDSNSSTAQVILKESKVNLKTGATSSEQTSLPVASSSQAGVMNSATYDAVTANTNNINAIMNGAVAITGLSANPSQSDLTTAWKNETGLSSLINRASVYDVTNNKVWTYYTNDTTWHAASNTSSVTVNTFTNSSEGTIKGSTNIGQVFAENDGTGSVNGWDALSSDVANAKSKLSGIQSGAEVNVQSDWNVSDSSSDAYIKNKPTIGNGTLTIQKNGTTIDTFTANSTTNKTVNITVPTVNDATLTIQKNGDTVQTFTANSSSNKTANIEVPTKTSELDNDAGFIANDTHQVCGEGGNITLNTTTFEPLEMNHFGGNTEQQTYTGKNLLKLTNGTYSKNGVTAVVDNGVITLSGTASAVTYIVLTASPDQYTLNLQGDYKLVTQAASGIYNVVYYDENSTMFNSTGSQVKSLSGEYTRVRFQLYIPNGTNTNGIKISPMIVVNGTDESFEPYVGGVPAPNPDYPQAVKVVTGENVVKICGKNLFDKSKATLGYRIGGDGIPYADSPYFISDFIPVKANTAYHINTANVGGSSAIATYDKDKVFIRRILGNGYQNIVTDADALYIRFTTSQTVIDQAQLELGSTATEYQPYQGQSYEVNLGKNLFEVAASSPSVSSGVTYTKISDSSFSIASDGTSSWARADIALPQPLELNTTYTFKVNFSSTNPSITSVRVAFRTASAEFRYYDLADGQTASLSTGNNVITLLRIYISTNTAYNATVTFTDLQLEKGSQATSYAAYFTPIELCKIGDYQDSIYKSDGKWYVHKEVDRKVLDGSEEWGLAERSGSNNGVFYIDYNRIGTVGAKNNGAFSNYARFISGYVSKVGQFDTHYSQWRFYAPNNTITLNEWKTNLGATPLDLYYLPATPTDTEITNQALVGQLEALWEADGYDSQTNITLTYAEGNAQGILSVCQYPSHLPVATKSKLGTIIVGHGLDIEDDGRLDVIVDSALSDSSINPVQNKAITTELNNKADISSVPTKTSQLENDSGFVVNDTTEICDEGSDITLNGTLLEPLDVKKIEGATSQQEYTGKNLFNLIAPATSNGVTVTANSDGSFNVKGTTTDVAVFNFKLPVPQPAGTYTFSCKSENQVMPSGGNFFLRARKSDMSMLVPSGKVSQLQGNGAYYNSATFTSTDEMYYVALNLTRADVTYDMVIYPQLEKSSTATSFEPYVGGVASPNPDYPQAVQTVTGENVVKICGKNLLEFSNASNSDRSSFTYSVETPEMVVATKNTTGGKFIARYEAYFEANKTYVFSMGAGADRWVYIYYDRLWGSLAGQIRLNQDRRTFTPTISGTYIVGFYTDGDAGTFELTNPMAELGSTATTYEPYQGQSYEVNLGKNLFDNDAATDAYIESDGTLTPNPVWRASQLIKVKPNTSYIWHGESYGTPNQVEWAGYDGSGAFISGQFRQVNGVTSTVITTGANTEYLRVGYRSDKLMNMQLELGSQATSYAAYFEPIELCKIGDYQDYIYKDGSDWKIKKQVGKFVLDSAKVQSAYNKRYRYAKSDLNNAYLPANGTNYLCGYFTAVANDSYGVGSVYSGGTMLNFRYDENGDNIAGFKNFIDEVGLSLYCPLNSFPDITITNEALVAQLEALWEADGVEGETNIFTVSDGVNERAILSVCQYPSHLPIATKTKLGTVVVGHGLDIEADGKLDVIVDDDFSTESEHPVQNKVITNALAGKADNTDLSTVAMTGSYDDLTGKPTIPTVNNATLTIQKNGTNVATFTANSSTNVTANITAPVVTMTTTDPGEGGALAANNFIGVYV